MLAGLVRGPTLYSPFADWKAARARQHEVLAAMVDVGKITQAQADKAFQEDISPPSHMFKPANNVLAPGFVSYVSQQLVQKYGNGATYGGALRVYTTLNMKMQQVGHAATSGTQANLAWRNVPQGAPPALDPSPTPLTP